MNNIHMLVNNPPVTFADIASGKVKLEKPGVSLDVENLSLEKNGVLLEAGLVLFDLADLSSVGRLPMLNVFFDTNDQILSTGHVDSETVKWWHMERIAKAWAWQQDASHRHELNGAIEIITDWCKTAVSALKSAGHDDIYWVARGEKDYPQLEYWTLSAGFEPICKYNRVQDVRSMTAAYLDKPQFYIKSEKPKWIRDLIKHSAIGDAITDAYDLVYARMQHFKGEEFVRQQVKLLETPEPQDMLKDTLDALMPQPESVVRDPSLLAAIEKFFETIKRGTHMDGSPGITYQISVTRVEDALAVLCKENYLAIPASLYLKAWEFELDSTIVGLYHYPRQLTQLPTTELFDLAYSLFQKYLLPDDKRTVDWTAISPQPALFAPASVNEDRRAFMKELIEYFRKPLGMDLFFHEVEHLLAFIKAQKIVTLSMLELYFDAIDSHLADPQLTARHGLLRQIGVIDDVAGVPTLTVRRAFSNAAALIGCVAGAETNQVAPGTGEDYFVSPSEETQWEVDWSTAMVTEFSDYLYKKEGELAASKKESTMTSSIALTASFRAIVTFLNAMRELPKTRVPEGDRRYHIVDHVAVDDLIRELASALGSPITVADVEKVIRYDRKYGEYVVREDLLMQPVGTFYQRVMGRPSLEKDR